MQVDPQQLQDVPTRHCWSFGSINHPSSQSRKISIGVMVDSIPKKPSEASKEGDIAGLNAVRVKNASHSVQGKGKIVEMTATKKTKQTEATELTNSPWISTRQKVITSETVPCPGRVPDLAPSGRRGELDGAKDAAATCSFSTKHASALQSDDDVSQNKFNGVSYKRKGRKDGRRESVKEFTFATVQDVLRPDEEVLKDKTNTTENGRTETLRLKLQEILGTVSSPNKSPTYELGGNAAEPDKEFEKMDEAVVKPRRISDKQEKKFDQMADNDYYSNSPTRGFGANMSKRDKKVDQMGDAVFKPKRGSDKQEQKLGQKGHKPYKLRQNSDTIETESDSPDNRVRRPVTRALTRKRAPTKVQKNTTKSGQLFGYKLKRQDKNIHSCKGGFPRRLHAAVSSSSPKATQQKNDKNNSRVEPRRLFHERDVADVIQKVTQGSETLLPAQRTSSFGNKMRDHLEPEKKIPQASSYNTPRINDRDNQHVDFDSPENIDQREEFGVPSARKQEHIVSPLVRNAVNLQDQQEDIDSPPVRNDVNLQDLPSPTLGINTPASSASLASTPKVDRMGEICGFRALQREKSDSDDDAHRKFSDAAKKLKDSLKGKTSPNMEENDSETRLSEDAETSLSEPSSDDGHSESSEDVSPITDDYNRCRESLTLSPETSPKKMKFIPRPAKRLRNHDINVQFDQINTPSLPIKGNGESKWIPESSGHNQVDGLTRAVEQFALELEKLKSKIKLATSKKSSEILMSVGQDVHLKLQNVESQIQTDMGKLKNLSTLKRKRMKTRFEEQQDKLRLIYETFKEQVNEHLQDCKSTFEGPEADELEFKGTLEKRKTSHQKLLLQVEGAIETTLNDAQRKITATHELARGKMLQLKQILALCLKEN
ncbi:meiosis-specific protein ASY3 [Morus notabilis]|uniref:meiosis-specific protein ASY3 n=1 Tax=Morus notabilis TaxID=981085 RepID=UPI000CED2005|nr:meiosis-specific protein ASY3 [Morus notabilis]